MPLHVSVMPSRVDITIPVAKDETHKLLCFAIVTPWVDHCIQKNPKGVLALALNPYAVYRALCPK